MDDETAIAAAPAGSPERLERIAAELRNGQKPEPVTVRELLSWFGAQRRGSFISFYIRSALDESGLTTNPDFVVPYIDSEIEFHLKESALPDPQKRFPRTLRSLPSQPARSSRMRRPPRRPLALWTRPTGLGGCAGPTLSQPAFRRTIVLLRQLP
jgi:hypothetical protein